MSFIWSWLRAVFSVTALWLGPRNHWGWLVGAFGQGLWIIYALSTRQYGFLISALAVGSAYLHNFKRAKKLHAKRVIQQAASLALAGVEP